MKGREKSEKKKFMHQTNHQAKLSDLHNRMHTYELRAICSWSSVGHGQLTSGGMLDLEIFVGKFLAVDALSTHAISHGEVACWILEENASKVELHIYNQNRCIKQNTSAI